MLIKLLGLLVAGVFVGATLYELAQRRGKHEALPADPEAPADEVETGASREETAPK